jgi:F-type H+-transporting ATPase subunit b
MRAKVHKTDLLKHLLLRIVYPLSLVTLMAVCAYAEGGGGHEEATNWKDFAWRTLNFAILMGFLYWLLAPKLKSFFVERRKNIKTSLEAAAAAKADAENKYKEYAAKLEKATDEIADIAESIKAQGVIEKERIIEDAKKAAAKIKEDAQARMEQEFKKASSQLRLEAAKLSVQMAEDILKRSITTADHDAMVRDYLDKVVTKH